MQVTTELRPLFSYSLLPIIFVVFCIIVLICFNKRKNKFIEKVPVVNLKSSIKDKSLIKERYLKQIDELIICINNNKVTNRYVHQKISIIIRKFVYEMTDIKVQNYTLEDIKKLNIASLYELISLCYEPEFSKISMGDVKVIVLKAKEVIIRWK